jgi:hypothetical protein
MRFEDLIVRLMDTVPLEAGDADRAGFDLVVTSLDVDMPIEARIEHGAVLSGSLPRGRLKTGFQSPHARLVVRFTSRSD